MVPIVPTLANVFGWQLHEEKPQKLHPPIFTNFIFSIREDIRFDGLKSEIICKRMLGNTNMIRDVFCLGLWL